MKLPFFRPRRQPPRAPRQRLIELPALAEDAEQVPPPGCGWFDSSHDLHHGLQVTEHACADTVAAELPLDGWIGLHLAGWRPAAAVLR